MFGSRGECWQRVCTLCQMIADPTDVEPTPDWEQVFVGRSVGSGMRRENAWNVDLLCRDGRPLALWHLWALQFESGKDLCSDDILCFEWLSVLSTHNALTVSLTGHGCHRWHACPLCLFASIRVHSELLNPNCDRKPQCCALWHWHSTGIAQTKRPMVSVLCNATLWPVRPHSSKDSFTGFPVLTAREKCAKTQYKPYC